MTAREARAMLGQTGTLALYQGTGRGGGTLYVEVKILDIREVYGRVDFLVTPVSGSGEVWKAESSVQVKKGGGK